MSHLACPTALTAPAPTSTVKAPLCVAAVRLLVSCSQETSLHGRSPTLALYVA
jgi:hypothetical protein